MGLCVLALLFLLSLACFGNSNSKHMICTDAGDVSGEVTNNEMHTLRGIGPKGDQGNKGEKGFSGSDGSPGTIDYDKVQEIVRLKVEEETRQYLVKVDNMVKQIRNMTSQISENRSLRMKVGNIETQLQNLTSLIAVAQSFGGVIHEGIIYWAEVHSSSDTNYAKAEEICSNKRSRPADIHGKDHYELIMNYIRGKLDGRSSTYVWTGMKKVHENNIAKLSNGLPAPYTHQRDRAYWDIAVKGWTHVFLLVRSSTNDFDQGMGAFPPNVNWYGALCQTE